MKPPADTRYPLHELIRARWSPRSFEPRDLPSAALNSLFEAARWSPSSYNEQPWRFIVAPRANRADFERFFDLLTPGNQVWAGNASALILAAAKKNFAHGDKPNPHAVHDLGQALGFLTLQATSMGLIVHQLAGFDRPRAAAELELPEGYEAVTMAAIGYRGAADALPAPLRAKELAPQTRLELEDLVFQGKWRPGSGE